MSPKASSQLRTVLIDLSGTLHIDNTLTPGAAKALEKLRGDSRLRIRFATNTTKESRRALHERLTRLGVNLSQDEIITSLSAARQYLDNKGLSAFLLVDEKAIEDFQGVKQVSQDEVPGAVVIGLAPEKYTRKNLNIALRYLIQGGCELVAIHEAKYYQTADGLSLGPGPFVRMLSYSSGVMPVVVGKPTKEFFNLCLPPGSDPSNSYIIGDDVVQDVGGGQKVGLKGYLVRTGKYLPGDEAKISPQPHHVAESFAHAVDHILENLSE